MACEEAMYLTNFASEVIMLVRRDVLRASKAMQEKVFKNEKWIKKHVQNAAACKSNHAEKCFSFGA